MTWIENKRVVITGATSGIGREVATRLASMGATVVLACRDQGRGEEVARAVGAAGAMTVDTSDPRSVRSFAARYHARFGGLDVLVNNAGVLLPERQTSVDGTELTFATNVVGYYAMATGLRAALEAATEPARVVNVASSFAFGLDLDDLQFERRPYDGMTAYAQSKACDRLLTWALARELPEPIAVNAVAPGLVLDTALYRHLSSDAKRELAQYGSRSVPAGADTIVWLASSAETDGVTGKFFEQRYEIDCEFRDEATETRLWRSCQELAGELPARR